MPVPNTFASATSAIPLANLDTNFATPITLGNTAVQLGNTITTINNVTLVTPTINTITSGSGSNLVLQSNNAVTAVTIDTNQNVGVGVTPTDWSVGHGFQLGATSTFWNDASSNTYITNNAYYNSGWKYLVSSVAATTYVQGSGNHVWNIASSGTVGGSITFTQAMTLDNSGNLSNTGSIIGGTYVKATSYIWGVSGMYIGSGTENGHIDQASHGTGTVTTYIGNQSINTSSDIRLKENVVNTTRNGLNLVNQLRVVDHTWNDPSDQCENNRNSRGVWMGLIAQEAQPIIPWLVNKPLEDVDKDGNPQYWHMDYGYSVPLLIKAIQELSAKVTALEAKVGV